MAPTPGRSRPRRLLVIARRRLPLLVLLVLAGMLAAFLGTNRSPTYEAVTTVYVGNGSTNVDTATEAAQSVLAASLAQLVDSPAVAKAAIASAHVPRSVDEIVKNTSATVAGGTNFIKVAVKDHDALIAKTMADSMAGTFVNNTGNLAPIVGKSINATKSPTAVAQLAGVPGTPLNDHVKRNVALGALVGLLVSIVVVLFLDSFGLSTRNPRELEEQLGVPVLGVVPRRRDLIGRDEPANLLATTEPRRG